MRDTLVNSCIAGTIAFLYKNLTNHLAYSMGITPFLYRLEAASLVLPLAQSDTVYGAIIGFFTDWVLVTWFTLVIAYILKKSGFDYAIFKGAFVGASSWVLVYGLIAHTGFLGLHKPTGIASGLTCIFFDVTMGMVSAYVLVRLNLKQKI